MKDRSGLNHPSPENSSEPVKEIGGHSDTLPNLELPPEPELISLGWERRYMADPDRANEAVRLYSDLGFEVRSEPVKPSELSEVCGDCRLIACKNYVTIYTRRPQR